MPTGKMHVREPLASPRKLHLILQACTAGPRVTIRSLICTKTVEGYGWEKKKQTQQQKTLKPNPKTWLLLTSIREVSQKTPFLLYTHKHMCSNHAWPQPPTSLSLILHISFLQMGAWVHGYCQPRWRKTAPAPPSLLIPRHEA